MERFAEWKRIIWAAALAEAHGGEPEAWMVWEGWAIGIGCRACGQHGRMAECWGAQHCHGYVRGCGCVLCQAVDMALAEELAEPLKAQEEAVAEGRATS